MKWKPFLFLAFLLISFKGYGQQFYVATSDGLLEQVTITPSGPVSQIVQGCGSYNYFSIAISGSKIFYNTPSGTLYSGDLTGGNSPTVSNCTLISTAVAANSLTIDKNGILYYANGNALYSLDPKNPNPVLLGLMPYSSAGDLAFYNGGLYMAAYEGIVDVNLADPSKSTLFIPIPNETIYSLTTTAVNGANVVYALTLGGLGTNLLELDMQNRAIKGVAGSVPFVAYDAGSEEETGSVPVIKVDNVDVSQECDVYNKGRAAVVCDPHTSLYTYTLNTGQNNTSGIFDNLAAGSYQVTIIGNGGELPANTSFTIPDYSVGIPFITAAIKNPVCDIGGQIKLDAGTANATYSVRYGNTVFGFDHTFTGLAAGSYHFTILNQQGCIAEEKDYTLQQDACPPIVLLNVQIQPECDVYGQASLTVITKDHPDNYTYTLNSISNTTGVFDFLTPGTYDLIITSSGGDRLEQQVSVPDYTLNKPQISYIAQSAVCALLGEIKFSVNGDGMGVAKIKQGAVLYNFDETIKGLTPGSNHFTILNQQGCIIDELDINITRDNCEPVVFPNAFTPNGDGINDIFRAKQDSGPVDFKLSVYDRWGALIFQSQSIYKGWDGSYGGKPAPPGVYYWIANYTMPGETGSAQKGYVTLVR